MTSKLKIALIGALLIASVSAASAQKYDTNVSSQTTAYDDMASKNKAFIGEIGG